MTFIPGLFRSVTPSSPGLGRPDGTSIVVSSSGVYSVAGSEISDLPDAGALSLSDKDVINRAGVDYSTPQSSKAVLFRKTPGGERDVVVAAGSSVITLTNADNDKAINITGSVASTLTTDGSTTGSFSARVFNNSSSPVSFSGITGVGITSIAPASPALIWMLGGTVYAIPLGAAGGAPPPSNGTAYTVNPSASSGTVGSAFIVTLHNNGNWNGQAITIGITGANYTLANGSGGTLSGNVLNAPAGVATDITFTITPTTAGTLIVSFTNNGTLSNPSSINYAASAASPGGVAYPTITTATRVFLYDAAVGLSANSLADQGPNGFTLGPQTAAVTGPLVNGLPTVLFNSNLQSANTGLAYNPPTSTGPLDTLRNDNTTLLVFKTGALSSLYQQLIQSEGWNIYLSGPSGLSLASNLYDCTWNTLIIPTLSSNTLYKIVIQLPTNSSLIYAFINGVKTSYTLGTSQATRPAGRGFSIMMGQANGHDWGDTINPICEWHAYSGVVSDAEAGTLGSYATSKWGS